MSRSAIFVTDLHGHTSRYEKLFSVIRHEAPAFVFLGGDLLPHGLKDMDGFSDLAGEFLFPGLRDLQKRPGDKYPEFCIILGNDDHRSAEEGFIQASQEGLIHYLNRSIKEVRGIFVFGYPFVPPTPFRIKDWEKFDDSFRVNPGCIPPTGGFRSIAPDYDPQHATIANDLDTIPWDLDPANTIMLFHSPPFNTTLDVVEPAGLHSNSKPVEEHIGSLAIRHFIEAKQPLLTLHGHVHESTRLTGRWRQRIGRTIAMNAAHDGPELCMIKFRDILRPWEAVRILA